MAVSIDEITVPGRAAGRYAVRSGPDGAPWLAEFQDHRIGEPPAGSGGR